MINLKNVYFLVPISILFTLIGCSKSDNNSPKTESLSVEKKIKKEDSDEQKKIDLVKAMYKEELNTHNGNEVLAKYSTQEFKEILQKDKNAQGEACVVDHNILMQSQDPNYEYAKFEFSIDEQDFVKVNFLDKSPLLFSLKCENTKCEINDVLVEARSLRSDINDCFEKESVIEKEPLQIKYRVYEVPQTINNTTIHKTFLELISKENNIKIQELNINRGRCSYSQFSGRAQLGFGDSVTYYVHCPLKNILEIEIRLEDGRTAMITN